MPTWLIPTAKETNRDTHQERSAGVLRSNKLNRKGVEGGASGCRAAYVEACAWRRRGMGRGRGRGRRSRSRRAGGEARGREQRREGRKRGRRIGRRARGSGTEAAEGGESPAAASRCVCCTGFWRESAVESVEEKRAPAALLLAPGGGGLGRREGGSLRWFSRCRALLAFLPAPWAPPGVSLAPGAPIPRSPPPAVCLDPEQRVSWGSS